MKEFVLSENFGIIGIKALLLERTFVVGMPLLAKFAIMSVKISVTFSSSSFGSPLSLIFSPVIVFRSNMNPKSSP